MTQTGLKACRIKDPACRRRDKSGLTAPGLVKMMTFKGGKGILFSLKIPFIIHKFSGSLNKQRERTARTLWFLLRHCILNLLTVKKIRLQPV